MRLVYTIFVHSSCKYEKYGLIRFKSLQENSKIESVELATDSRGRNLKGYFTNRNVMLINWSQFTIKIEFAT